MSEKTLDLSVVIPVYKTFTFLEEAIRSCCSDTLQVETIVVEDGPSEGLATAIEVLRQRYEGQVQIRLVQLPENKGTFLARKAGALVAKGHYVTFLDSDDYFKEGAMDVIAKAIGEGAYDCILYPFLYEKNNVVMPTSFAPALEGELITEYLLRCSQCCVWSSAGKIYANHVLADDYASFAAIDERLVFSEDWLLLIGALRYVKTFRCIDKWLYFYRNNAVSAMNQAASVKSFHLKQLKAVTARVRALYTNVVKTVKEPIADEAAKHQLLAYEQMCHRTLYLLDAEQVAVRCNYQETVLYKILLKRVYLKYYGFELQRKRIARVKRAWKRLKGICSRTKG